MTRLDIVGKGTLFFEKYNTKKSLKTPLKKTNN